MKKTGRLKTTTLDIALIGMMVAVIEVCKVALMSLPNIELTTFWIIMFTLFFGKKILFVIPVFILLEGSMFGVSLWWIMYLYIWPSLALIAWICRRQQSVWFWSILSAVYGLFFGLFCAIPYVVIGAVDGGIVSGLYAGFTWWIAGIPYDLLHCVGNFVLMLVLYHPVKTAMNKVNRILVRQ